MGWASLGEVSILAGFGREVVSLGLPAKAQVIVQPAPPPSERGTSHTSSVSLLGSRERFCLCPLH